MLLISIAVTAGVRSGLPEAVERTASYSSSLGASLRRYPVAPASTARRMSASVS